MHMCRDSFNIIVIPANGLVQTSMFNSCDEKDKIQESCKHTYTKKSRHFHGGNCIRSIFGIAWKLISI